VTGFYNRKECVYCVLRSAHTVYLCVFYPRRCVFTARYDLPKLCIYERLFHCTALSDWILYPRMSVFTARYLLSAQCISVFCVDLRTNCDYFTEEH
jgi:hypothetical protein